MEEAQQAMLQVMGSAIDIDPMDALLWCIRITAGEVAYATWKIEQLEEGEAVLPPISKSSHEATGGDKMESWEETSEGIPDMNIWIKTRRDSMDRLAKYSKMALDAGVAERQIQLAETAGDSLAMAIRGILDGLNLTVEQEQNAPQLVRKALEQLEKTNSPQLEAA